MSGSKYKNSISIFLSMFICSASAKNVEDCRLPAPDGTIETASQPNLHGVIKSIDIATEAVMLQMDTDEIVYFVINKETQYFNAFGGDFTMAELRDIDNVEAWVWYKNCDIKNKSEPVDILKLYPLASEDRGKLTSEYRGQ